MPRINRKLYTLETYQFLILERMNTFFQTNNISHSKRICLNEYVKRGLILKLGGKCLICGLKDDLELDHITPLGKGGSNNLINFQLLCIYHHKIKTKIDCFESKLYLIPS